ncbi:hypothetical protein EV426DRAFT_592326 [Tirmania nivea]|nr:hypothetical protein EV426DRAFT_592326 [Tirmania nivea]
MDERSFFFACTARGFAIGACFDFVASCSGAVLLFAVGFSAGVVVLGVVVSAAFSTAGFFTSETLDIPFSSPFPFPAPLTFPSNISPSSCSSLPILTLLCLTPLPTSGPTGLLNTVNSFLFNCLACNALFASGGTLGVLGLRGGWPVITGLCKPPPASELKSTRFRDCVVAAVATLLEDGRVGGILLGLTEVKRLEVGPMEEARRGGVERRALGLSVVIWIKGLNGDRPPEGGWAMLFVVDVNVLLVAVLGLRRCGGAEASTPESISMLSSPLPLIATSRLSPPASAGDPGAAVASLLPCVPVKNASSGCEAFSSAGDGEKKPSGFSNPKASSSWCGMETPVFRPCTPISKNWFPRLMVYAMCVC